MISVCGICLKKASIFCIMKNGIDLLKERTRMIDYRYDVQRLSEETNLYEDAVNN